MLVMMVSLDAVDEEDEEEEDDDEEDDEWMRVVVLRVDDDDEEEEDRCGKCLISSLSSMVERVTNILKRLVDGMCMLCG
jgi:hypothetical protein